MSKIESAVKKAIGEGCEIEFRKVLKNNAKVLQAIVVREPDGKTCPVIYIDELLEKIENGSMDEEEAAIKIFDLYRNADTGGFGDISKILDRENILKKVVYQIINTERNRERLKDIPHRDLLNLLAIYKIIINEDDESQASITLDYELCNAYGINTSELDAAARQNTKEGGFFALPMAEMMAKIMGIPCPVIKDEMPAMFVLTNKSGNEGASVMLYKEYFAEVASKLKSDLYVLPSSIHEVIAVPTEGYEPWSLTKMVGEINDKEVAEEEVLGDSIYRYSLMTGNLSIER
ncbi:MAG: hypothetical protein HFI99_17055 [Lachnospiraceae bacterium]|nr:hypothetical protein [Lachnospiraceae bacterium]